MERGAKKAVTPVSEQYQLEYTTDSTRAYLNKIGEYPLLTHEEEVDLAKRIAASKIAEDIKETSPEQSEKLAQIKSLGEAALNRLIASNLRLVVANANREGYAQSYGSLLSAVQEGSIGLVRAAHKFDHRKGYKFSTYASWWIKQSFQRGQQYADHASVRLPTNAQITAYRAKRLRQEHRAQYHEELSIQDLAKLLSVPEKSLRLIDQAQWVKSFDEKLSDEENSSTFGDITPSNVDVEDEVVSSITSVECLEALELALTKLSYDEYKIVAMRFGLHGHEPTSRTRVGEVFNIRREKIKVIETEALDKIRNYLRRREFDSLEDISA